MKLAVILAGSGYLDGAEIREAVFTLLALENQQIDYQIFAPNIDQYHVVNHLTGEATEETRNVLVESARIARGDITDLAQLNTADFDGVVLPGGFGVAKNLSTFAFDGSNATLNPQLAECIGQFYTAKKPIGAICIAPAIIALALGEYHPTLTIGTDEGTASELEKLGATHQNSPTDDYVIDTANKIVTTPAYMDGTASMPTIFAGISKLIEALTKL